MTISMVRQLAHELAHAYRWLKGKGKYTKGCRATADEETEAWQITNAVAKEIKEPERGSGYFVC
jgi:hypothetical protein